VAPPHEREAAIDQGLARDPAFLEKRLEVGAGQDPPLAQPGFPNPAGVCSAEHQRLRQLAEARAARLEVVEPGHVRRQPAVGDHRGPARRSRAWARVSTGRARRGNQRR
jgi:hypothetical protein